MSMLSLAPSKTKESRAGSVRERPGPALPKEFFAENFNRFKCSQLTAPCKVRDLNSDKTTRLSWASLRGNASSHRGLTEANHILHELLPEKEQTTLGVTAVPVLGRFDDSIFEIVVHQLLHLLLDISLKPLGVGQG